MKSFRICSTRCDNLRERFHRLLCHFSLFLIVPDSLSQRERAPAGARTTTVYMLRTVVVSGRGGIQHRTGKQGFRCLLCWLPVVCVTVVVGVVIVVVVVVGFVFFWFVWRCFSFCKSKWVWFHQIVFSCRFYHANHHRATMWLPSSYCYRHWRLWIAVWCSFAEWRIFRRSEFARFSLILFCKAQVYNWMFVSWYLRFQVFWVRFVAWFFPLWRLVIWNNEQFC